MNILREMYKIFRTFSYLRGSNFRYREVLMQLGESNNWLFHNTTMYLSFEIKFSMRRLSWTKHCRFFNVKFSQNHEKIQCRFSWKL